jgi:hypothetical protein
MGIPTAIQGHWPTRELASHDVRFTSLNDVIFVGQNSLIPKMFFPLPHPSSLFSSVE